MGFGPVSWCLFCVVQRLMFGPVRWKGLPVSGRANRSIQNV
jgi:hypothetical protein